MTNETSEISSPSGRSSLSEKSRRLTQPALVSKPQTVRAPLGGPGARLASMPKSPLLPGEDLSVRGIRRKIEGYSGENYVRPKTAETGGGGEEKKEPVKPWDEVYINSRYTHDSKGTHEPDMGLFSVVGYSEDKEPIRQKVALPPDIPDNSILKVRLPDSANAYYLLHPRDSLVAKEASRAVNIRERRDDTRSIRLVDHLSSSQVDEYKAKGNPIVDWNEEYLPQFREAQKQK